jgi:hypothetical protein
MFKKPGPPPVLEKELDDESTIVGQKNMQQVQNHPSKPDGAGYLYQSTT